MTIRNLPVIPNFEGWAAGGNLSQPALEYENEKRAVLQEMKEAIVALQNAADDPDVVIIPLAVQSEIAWYDKSGNVGTDGLIFSTETALGLDYSFTPRDATTKLIITAGLHLFSTNIATIGIRLSVDGTVVESQAHIKPASWAEVTRVFEYQPQGAAATYDLKLTSSETTSARAGGGTFIRIDEIRQD